VRAKAGQRMIEANFGRMLAPTTAIGCAALLRHIEAHEASYDRCLFDDCADSVGSNGHQLLSHIAAMLEAKVCTRWRPRHRAHHASSASASRTLVVLDDNSA